LIPGLEENGFNFPAKFKSAVEAIFKEELETVEVMKFQRTFKNIKKFISERKRHTS